MGYLGGLQGLLGRCDVARAFLVARSRPCRGEPTIRHMGGTLWKFGLAGLLFGGTAACVIDLDHKLNCGDGFTDEDAGEDCDPLDPQSVESACEDKGFASGLARCDPMACKIEVSAELCAVCGDGVLSPGEQCDGASLGSRRCPSGEDLVACDPDTCLLNYDACPTCGNGQLEVELGEECDWNYDPGDAVEGEKIDCTDLEPIGSIQYKGYSQGAVSVNACTKSCQLARKECSFCGDGIQDDSYSDLGLQGNQVTQGAEVCDGQDASDEAIQKHCKQVCADSSNLNFRCDFDCVDNCTTMISPATEEANCCVVGGQECDPVIPCCFELDNPGEEGCGKVAVGDPDVPLFFRCRSL